jgi:tetratricopeptide (TPR) repeat protein
MKETKTLIDKCWMLVESGQYQEAIESCKSLLENNPNNFNAYHCLGLAYYGIGELNLAYEVTKKAESLASNNIELMHIYSLIGSILHQMDYFSQLPTTYRGGRLL